MAAGERGGADGAIEEADLETADCGLERDGDRGADRESDEPGGGLAMTPVEGQGRACGGHGRADDGGIAEIRDEKPKERLHHDLRTVNPNSRATGSETRSREQATPRP